jgi:predicted RNA-binding Zn-ribbon protein involved in translation (DUF1610 family)
MPVQARRAITEAGGMTGRMKVVQGPKCDGGFAASAVIHQCPQCGGQFAMRRKP